MNLALILTPDDHRAALCEIEALWSACENSADGDRLEDLVSLVEAYEDQHWPIVKRGHVPERLLVQEYAVGAAST